MTATRGLNGATNISFTPSQLVATFAFVLAAGLWCWKIDKRTEDHDVNMKAFSAKIDKDINDFKTEVKTEFNALRRGYTLTPTTTPVTEGNRNGTN